MKLNLKSFFRFCLLTVMSFTINCGLTAFLHEVFAVDERIAFATALIVVFTVNFLMKRYYVFRARDGDPKRQLLLFFFSSLGFRGAEYVAFLAVHSLLSIHYLVVVIGVLFISFIVKFFYYGMFVFRGFDAKSV